MTEFEEPTHQVRVEVPGRDVCIPILFVPRILSRESKTRTLNSTSTSDYKKKLQLFRYKILINMSCHDGKSTMMNFGQLTLPCHYVCEMLNDLFNHVCESRLWNFLCSQHLEIKPSTTVRVKIHCFILINEYLYHCWCFVPALFKSDPTSLDPGSIGVVRVHAKWTAK